ncbi:hypothetical protein [Actinoallomurus sp. NPDC050550]|uniref:hypothetical protein n=1 Tax=Actinoallomurus sp. NPDC050550 TaxID=3154937 RepID=UPI0033E0A6E5
MSQAICIDDEVKTYIQWHAGLDDTPKRVLRRLLGMDDTTPCPGPADVNDPPNTTASCPLNLEGDVQR